mgnify:FL=1
MEIVTIEKTDARYPQEFRDIGAEAPEKIYALGNVELLNEQKFVAILGARKATRDGN